MIDIVSLCQTEGEGGISEGDLHSSDSHYMFPIFLKFVFVYVLITRNIVNH